ncbi:MAG: hypothetical protein IID45_16085, partial [Planctomycetes bacterium]|nr:hypothetical protein [Planctomycetota bacterium]
IARTLFQQAHIYDKNEKEFRILLDESFKEFEKIHSAMRSQGFGLYARMWQGKCFEEQNEIGRALGLYNELLEHPGTSRLMLRIQRQVMHFRLICLNHPKKNDHLIVNDDASEWLRKNRRYKTTTTGLGVLYERAKARVALGTHSEMTPKDKRRYLGLAREDVVFISRFPGKYRIPAAVLMKQIKRARGEKVSDPKDFSEAIIAAAIVYGNIKPDLDKLGKARREKKPQAEIDKLTAALKADLAESAKLHRMAQRMYQSKDDVNRLNRSRFVLAYLYHLQAQNFGMTERSYDGAVLAGFIARHARKSDPDLAKDAAYLAMALFIQAYNHAREDAREAEMHWIINSGRFIVAGWPGTKRAAEASFNVGKMFDKRGESLNAARWFARIPASSRNHYASAQIYAGQSFLSHFLKSISLKQTPEVVLAALKGKNFDERVTAMADLLNPSWRKWKWSQRELQQLLAQLPQKAAPQPKPKAKKKPNKKKKTGKKKSKSKKSPVKNQPLTRPKPKKKQQPPPPQKTKAKPPSAALVARIAELKKTTKQLLDKSRSELAIAVHELTNRKRASLEKLPPHTLRTTLTQTLKKLVPETLKAKYEKHLEGLSPQTRKNIFNDDLRDWKQAAANHLSRGIRTLEKEISQGQQSIDLIAAKTSYAVYLNMNSEYQQVLKILTGGEH